MLKTSALILSMAAFMFAASAAQALALTPEKRAECRANLEKRLCYTAPVKHWYENTNESLPAALKKYQNRVCLERPIARLNTMLNTYDSFPSELQLAFCAMKRIYIVKGDVTWGAQTEYFFDEKTLVTEFDEIGSVLFKAVPTGYVLELNEASRFAGESSSAYVTRVTQSRFQHNVRANGVSSLLPQVEYTTPFGTDGALATTIIHEIGHMAQRAQGFTSGLSYLPRSQNNWNQISWNADGYTYSVKKNPKLWSQIVEKRLSAADVTPVLSLMKELAFPTLYSSNTPDEDFAEWFMLSFYGDFKVTLGAKTLLDFKSEAASNTAFKRKLDLIRKITMKEDLYSLKDQLLIEGNLNR